jgi:hypothetical protein
MWKEGIWSRSLRRRKKMYMRVRRARKNSQIWKHVCVMRRSVQGRAVEEAAAAQASAIAAAEQGTTLLIAMHRGM